MTVSSLLHFYCFAVITPKATCHWEYHCHGDNRTPFGASEPWRYTERKGHTLPCRPISEHLRLSTNYAKSLAAIFPQNLGVSGPIGPICESCREGSQVIQRKWMLFNPFPRAREASSRQAIHWIRLRLHSVKVGPQETPLDERPRQANNVIAKLR